MDYSTFDIADFTADEYFVAWVLDPSKESDVFWKRWLEQYSEKNNLVHEARLVVLMMHSQNLKMNSHNKVELWKNIQREAFEKNHVTATREAAISTENPGSNWQVYYRIAAVVLLGIGLAFTFYYTAGWWGEKNYIVTANPKGKKSEMLLPDGTKVWLNADSKLSYLADFEEYDTREVFLEGEAFFDVAHDESKPFIVRAADMQVKVLGTAFNVKSYPNEPQIETTLLRGKVMVETREKDKNTSPLILKEGEQAVYSNASKELSLATINAADAASWKDGKLVFMNKSFKEIKTELERWYGVEIELEGNTNTDCRFSTTIENQPITKILELFNATSGMTYEINNTTIKLAGKICPDE